MDLDDPAADAVARLRRHASELAVPELAALLQQSGLAYDFADVVDAAQRVQSDPQDARALYDLGYACIERGLAGVAVPLLRGAFELLPQQPDVIGELVTAYELEARYAEAVALLQSYDALPAWPMRYLLAVNAVMAGDLELARTTAHGLEPPEPGWQAASERLEGMLRRADELGAPGLGDVRGWHYVLNDAVLASLSPFGFPEPMHGRWAYLGDSVARCRQTLDRTAAVLQAASATVRRVGLLPDRGSQILGHAAAALLGLPVGEWRPDGTDTLVVAYDLRRCAESVLGALQVRAPGSVLVEHATCWTDPPAIAADVSGLLVQTAIAPWDEAPTAGSAGEPSTRPVDHRRAEVVAAEVASAAPTTQQDDTATGDGPADLVGFVRGLPGRWPPVSPRRDRLWSPGPVPSNRFV